MPNPSFKSRSVLQALSMIAIIGAFRPAAAMNQEGHYEGWMADFPPGIEVFTSGEAQKPLPSPQCPVTWEMVRANPYEQILLPWHGCGRVHPEFVREEKQ